MYVCVCVAPCSREHSVYFEQDWCSCRDHPKDMPVFVASNAAKENGILTPRGENIFAAVK